MPDHIHLLLTPAFNVQLEKAVQFIKGGFSFRLKEKAGIWARGSFERRVLTPEAFEAAVKYIHDNPVVAHIVDRANTSRFLLQQKDLRLTQHRRGCAARAKARFLAYRVS